ncbi:hypothetical protein BH23THE1_BH23THE1_06260 [soil metagenome]
MGKNVVLCMVSYKPILIAGLIMIVVGAIGISITAPIVVRESVPDTEFNIQSPPTETEFRNPMVDAEIVSIMLVIVGWAVSLYGWYAKTDKKNPSIPS